MQVLAAEFWHRLTHGLVRAPNILPQRLLSFTLTMGMQWKALPEENLAIATQKECWLQ